jgi:hypothetical protein
MWPCQIDNKSILTSKIVRQVKLSRVSRLVSKHLMKGLLAVSTGGPHCLWCPKTKWSPPLGTSVTLKIDKNWLKARKLRPPKQGGLFFFSKFLNQTTQSLFPNPAKKSLNIILLPLELQHNLQNLGWRFQSGLNRLIWKKMRRLCTDEVEGVKMKKNEKKMYKFNLCQPLILHLYCLILFQSLVHTQLYLLAKLYSCTASAILLDKNHVLGGKHTSQLERQPHTRREAKNRIIASWTIGFPESIFTIHFKYVSNRFHALNHVLSLLDLLCKIIAC